ncbi:MAG: metal-dependent hydrolase [Nanoarchaeota archaeon]
MFKTHLLISLLIGIFLFPFFDINKFVFVLLIILAGSLPDIDLPKSKIGNMFKPLSLIINFFFGHRGFFHSIFFPLILLFVFAYFNKLTYGLIIFVGYTGHLLADSLSREGISFLQPFSRFRINGFLRVGGFLEYILFFLLLVFTVLSIPRMF